MKRVAAMIGLTAALMACPAPAPTAPGPAAEMYAVPYRLTAAKHILVRAKVNGRGPFNLIVDTGAPALVLAKKLAEPLRLTAEHGWTTLAQFEIEGGVRLDGVTARLDDLFQLEGMNGLGLAGVEIHGVMGYPILARFRIEYDFTKPKLIWTASNHRPAELPRAAHKGGAAGGLDALGAVMKAVGRFFGMNKLPPAGPRGFVGLSVREEAGRLIVASVVSDGPAVRAGLAAGDPLRRVNGRDVKSVADVERAMAAVSPGDQLKFELGREPPAIVTVTTGPGF